MQEQSSPAPVDGFEPRPNTKTPEEAGVQIIEYTDEVLNAMTDEQLIQEADRLGIAMKPSYDRGKILTKIIAMAHSISDS